MPVNQHSLLGTPAIVLLLLTIPGCVSWSYNRDVPLTSRISIHENHTREYSAISGVAHAGTLPVVLPIPSKSDRVKEKAVLIDGTCVGRYGADAEFHPSPNERFLVVESGLRCEPMLVVDTDSRRSVVVAAPTGALEGHYYTYPFRFVRWAPDSAAFFVEASGHTLSSESDRGLVEYVELWVVDPQLGRPVRQDRQERPSQAASHLPPGFLEDCVRRANADIEKLSKTTGEGAR